MVVRLFVKEFSWHGGGFVPGKVWPCGEERGFWIVPY
jgi:hypothetical protein